MNTGLADQLAFAEEARRVAEELAKARLAECAALKKRLATAEKAQTAAERLAAEGELVRRKLHNTILVRVPLHPSHTRSDDRLLRSLMQSMFLPPLRHGFTGSEMPFSARWP